MQCKPTVLDYKKAHRREMKGKRLSRECVTATFNIVTIRKKTFCSKRTIRKSIELEKKRERKNTKNDRFQTREGTKIVTMICCTQ